MIRSRYVPVLAAVLTMGACHDGVTTPEPPSKVSPSMQPSHGAAFSPSTPYVCAVGEVGVGAPSMYTYKVLSLAFPQGTIARDGSTMYYRYRKVAEKDGTTLVEVNCLIPNTRPAVELTHRQFRVPANATISYVWTTAAAGELTTQSCGTADNPCELEGIVVIVKQPAGEEEEEENEGGGGGGTPGTGDPGGGDDGGDPDGGAWSDPAGESSDGLGEDEYSATSCPSLIYGRTITKGITVGGRLHTFKFSGTMARVGPAPSPAWYSINPTLDEEGWWLALQGKIKIACSGLYSPSINGKRLWVGTTTAVDGPNTDDISMVKGPNNPY